MICKVNGKTLDDSGRFVCIIDLFSDATPILTTSFLKRYWKMTVLSLTLGDWLIKFIIKFAAIKIVKTSTVIVIFLSLRAKW